MTSLTKTQLLHNFVQSVAACGWTLDDVSRTPDGAYRFVASKSSQVAKLKIYFWNVSGGGNTRPDDEYRIQPKVEKFAPEDGYVTLILGWWDTDRLIVGWDYRKHTKALGKSPSFQIKQQALVAAATNGISAYRKNTGEAAIALKPHHLMDYSLNAEELHDIGSEPNGEQILKDMFTATGVKIPAAASSISAARQKQLQQVVKFVRDSTFRERVLRAYERRCAACGVQLDLVEAAHIVPVAIPNSTDETKNGLALCAIHHKAYDKRLLVFAKDYKIQINSNLVDKLKANGQADGLNAFKTNLRTILDTPPDPLERPDPSYLEIGNQQRLKSLGI